jgi:hypothetical protein
MTDVFDVLAEDHAEVQWMLAGEHIRFEETRVWPRARLALSSQAAAELGTKIAEGKKIRARDSLAGRGD